MRTVPHSARRVTPVMISVVMVVTCLTVFPGHAEHIPDDLLKHALEILAEMHSP